MKIVAHTARGADDAEEADEPEAANSAPEN